MKERIYTAYCDNGHDFFDFCFVSTHRANSKANFEDAKRLYNKHCGRSYFKILQTVREPDDFGYKILY